MRQVPSYDKHEYASKKHKYCVAIFVINEGERLNSQLQRMQPLSSLIDIVVADGGSSDGSTNDENLQKQDVNTLLVKTGSGKLGTQMRMAFDWALKREYEGVVIVDGNNKDGVEQITSFITKLDEGYDHIQGSRFVPGGHHEHTPITRLLGVKLLHAPLISLVSGFPYTDTTNGFRAYSARLLADTKIHLFRDIFNGYELHYYLAIKAPKLGYKCIEIPVSRRYPPHGATPTKISPVRGNINVLKKLFAVCTGRYDP